MADSIKDVSDIFSHDKMDVFLGRPTREIFGELLERIEKLEAQVAQLKSYSKVGGLY